MRSHLQPATKTEQESRGKLLIADCDDSIRWALRETLGGLGFEISEVACGEQAIAMIQTVRFDAVLLEVAMSGMDGLEVCRKIRELAPGLAIVMLSAAHSDTEKLRALGAGADDYVIRPFEAHALAASIRLAVGRSRSTQADDATAVIQIGDIDLDPANRRIRKGGLPVRLTAREFDLLHYLMANAGLSLTHERLLGAVWGPEYSREVLRTYVRRLRRKLGDQALHPRYLLTDSHGYRFNCEQ